MEILLETPSYIILNKPSGVLSIPDREGKETSVKQQLKEKYGEIWTVHRLDRDTSGLILFAKTDEAHAYFSGLFEGRDIIKLYLGLVHGTPAHDNGSIDAPIAEHPAKNGTMVVYRKGKASLTDYEVLESFRKFSWMKFRIHTGRTHQIRVHMKHLGHPIICDPLYGTADPVYLSQIKRNYKLSKQEEQERPILNRLALHAWSLTFTDDTGIERHVEAPLPKDLRALLQQLEKTRKSA